MYHYSYQQQQASQRQSNKVYWRLSQASQKISSRSILKNKWTRQWYTCTWEDKDWNQLERNLRIQTWKIRTKTLVFSTTLDPSTMMEGGGGGAYSDLCGHFPITSSRVNKYIYVMYLYDCNTILTVAMQNISYKEMVRSFTELNEFLKNLRINPGFHFMNNEASTDLKMAMSTMDIKYQLVLPSNHTANNA